MKRIFALVLTLLLFCLCTITSFAAQALSIPKIVSVVFDDSGSMNDETKKWVYANYAMQAFAGLLNNEDELYITYMSEYGNSKQFDMTKNIQNNVDDIRAHFSQNSGTPVNSVYTAINKLKSVQNANPNTQYWLVIITDGMFATYDVNGNQEKLIDSDDLEKIIYGFTEEKMPNGSKPQVSYLTIGSDTVKLKANIDKNIYSYSAISSDEIVDVMSELADMVSGRIRIPSEKITFIDDKTIQLTSALPMLNIAVLIQKSSTQVTEIKGTDAKLTLQQSAKLLYPKKQGILETDESLKGSTFLFDNGQYNTPSGTYTFTFNEPINSDSVVIMYEPAIEMKMKIYHKNTDQEVMDIRDLFADDEIDIVCNIYESGTDNIIDPNLLSSSVSYNIAYYENDDLIYDNTDSTLTINGIKLKDIKSKLESTIEIKGFLPMTNSISFNPMPPIEYTMQVTDFNGNEILRTELHNNDKSLIYTVLGDGVPLTIDELNNLNVHFTINDQYNNKLGLRTIINGDGTYTVTPIYDTWNFPWKFWVSYPLIGIPTGQLEITGGIGNGRYDDLVTGTIQIISEPWYFTFMFFFLPLFILFCMIGWFIKKRFKRKSKAIYINFNQRGNSIRSIGANWSSKKLNSFNIWSMMPWVCNRTVIGGLKVYARHNGTIGIKIKDIRAESRKVTTTAIREGMPVELRIISLDDPLIITNDNNNRRNKNQNRFKIFKINDVYLNTYDLHFGTIIKFIGGK